MLLAWDLGLGLRLRQPGFTAARLVVAYMAATPLFWLGLLVTLVLVRYLEWDLFSNSSQIFWSSLLIGFPGGLWAGLEMRSREDASPLIVLARAAGLVLRHGGMLVSGVIVLELCSLFPVSEDFSLNRALTGTRQFWAHQPPSLPGWPYGLASWVTWCLLQ